MVPTVFMNRALPVLSSSLWLLAAPAAAQPDYAPDSEAWNGLATLRATFREQSVELRAPRTLDLESLGTDDALLILYPRRPLPAAGLAAFMRAGGRVALADDFGLGEELLEVYRIESRPPDRSEAPTLRGNPHLPLARPRVRHALTGGVHALATNHPRTLFHANLDPLFSLDDDRNAVVLAGAVGEGRLVAIADPSILINNMLLVRDNARFAANLASYLAPPGGHVYLITPNSELRGGPTPPEGSATFDGLRESIRRLATADLPPIALKVLSAALVLALVVLATTMLPRRSPYDGSTMFAKPALAGGFVGRLEFFSRPRQNLLHPTLVYKFELETELLRRLKLGSSTLLRDVVRSLKQRGFAPAEIESARRLLLTLDELREKQDHPPAPPKVSPLRFRHLVAEGERLLRRIDETTSSS